MPAPPLRAFRIFAARLRAIFAIATLAMLVVSCGGSGSTPAAQADVTLLVYMMGTNLESDDGSATLNIDEMRSIAPSDRVNVVLTTGAAKKDGWRTVQRKRVLGQRVELLDDLGAVDMGSAKTLQDFVSWGMKTYPAERTMLVLWDHGGGPNHGIGSDPFTGHALSLDALRSALAPVTQASGRKLALIGFDACLMASVEVGQALAPYADYMVASQELEPGTGQDWAALLTHLTRSATDSTEAFGRTMVDAFVAKQLKENPVAQATLSLVDLSRIDGVTAALADISATLNGQLATEPVQTWLDIAQARSRAFIFGSNLLSPGPMELVDLRMFEWNSLRLTDAQRERLTQALEQAVVHQKHTEAFSNLAGLTFYLPQRVAETSDDTNTYTALAFLPDSQRSFIRQHSDIGTDNTKLPLPTIGVVDWNDGTPNAPTSVQADLNAVDRGLVEQDFAAVQDASGWLTAIKPLTDSTVDQLVDPSFMQGWFHLDDAGTPVYFSALPDGMRFAVDSPENFMIPVSVRGLPDDDDDDDDDSLPGMLIVSDAAEPGVLRITGFLSSVGDNFSAGVPRPQSLPADATVQPLWLVQDENDLGHWIAPPASAAVPFVPVAPNQQILRGTRDQLPSGSIARLGIVDVRGWISLDTRAY
ncbi:Clostripain family protein [Pigmentiphaga humi]|uniref:Clostripain family protein n=1 Tax=Pigmentiphaga humi TaxID=2478468 RepID=A0A3P4B519_9BURK|nr:clostripain-related cysteine peptidase [Pigmentiphaga humi]VCU71389.1 Clostripain family protein [Pigmentiphaga humi]